MKAVLCKAWGPPETLVVEDVPAPKPGKGQVVVAVQAAGVNFPDVLIVQGKYQVKPEFPFSPGAEVAGTVKEVGEGVTHVKAGDYVVAFPGLGGFAEEVADYHFVIYNGRIVYSGSNEDFKADEEVRARYLGV